MILKIYYKFFTSTFLYLDRSHVKVQEMSNEQRKKLPPILKRKMSTDTQLVSTLPQSFLTSQ